MAKVTRAPVTAPPGIFKKLNTRYPINPNIKIKSRVNNIKTGLQLIVVSLKQYNVLCITFKNSIKLKIK
jgi:hypothetical protein